MKIYDITFAVSDKLPKWPGSVGYSVTKHLVMPDAVNNLSSIQMDCHLGTHLDAPSHFVHLGKSVEELDLEVLLGDVYVISIPNTDRITSLDLDNADIPLSCKRLLIKTDNQSYWDAGLTEFQENFCALDASAAIWLVERKIRLVGIDYLSIQKYQDGPRTHQIFLENNVVIVETLKLGEVVTGWYELICLPLKLEGLEGAPARVILIKNEL